MADNRYRFAVPGENSGNENTDSNLASREGEAKLPDFSKMTKQEIKEYDAIHGSYKRLLGDKPITFFWLMNHYSKANAEAYNRQKNARITQSSEEKSEKRKKQDFEEKSDPGKKMTADPEYRSDNDDLSRLRYGKESVSGTEDDYHRERAKREYYSEDDYERTVFIDATGRAPARKKSGARIVCVGFDQTVEIRKTPFVIGRSTKNVDLCIMDNTAISSRHAQIIEKNGEYYIVDMGSLNHVYINNAKIPEYIEVALKNNTTFRLADEEFIFQNE